MRASFIIDSRLVVEFFDMELLRMAKVAVAIATIRVKPARIGGPQFAQYLNKVGCRT